MDNSKLVNVVLTINEADILFNALEEKIVNATDLKNKMYKDISRQINDEKKEDIMKEKEFYCKDCGKIFVLTEGEISFYERKGLLLPTRCKECREARKKEKEFNKFKEEMNKKFKENTVSFNK